MISAAGFLGRHRDEQMTAHAPLSSREVWLPPLLLILLVLAVGAGGDAVHSALRYDRAAIESGEIWRLLTGNFVHLGWWHLFLNALGVIVLVMLCPEPLPWLVWVRRLVLIGLGMSLGLFLFVPDVRWYVGLSGVMHGLFMLGLGRQAFQKRDLIALGCLAYLVGKIAWEMTFGVAVSDEAAIGGSVLVESHLYGTLSAIVYGLVFSVFTRSESIARERGEST